MARRNQTKKFLQLGTVGQRIFKDLGGNDSDPLERYFIEALARTLEIAAEADKMMAEEGMIQKFDSGARNVTPEWAVYRNAINDAKSLAKDLGKIRDSLGVEAEEEAEQIQDPFNVRSISASVG